MTENITIQENIKLCECGKCNQKVTGCYYDSKNHIWIQKRFINGHQSRGVNNPAWKGGKIYDDDEYVLIWKPDHPFADNRGYVREHRLVYEEYYNCCLLPWAISHHINGIKDDNRIENILILKDQCIHAKLHHTGNNHRRGYHKDTSDRHCYNCDSKTTYIQKPTIVSLIKSPIPIWRHIPTDKINWYCQRCYDNIRKL